LVPNQGIGFQSLDFMIDPGNPRSSKSG